MEFMRALHEKVNIVPVLGKADCLTPLEVSQKKKKVRMSLSFAQEFNDGVALSSLPYPDTRGD